MVVGVIAHFALAPAGAELVKIDDNFKSSPGTGFGLATIDGGNVAYTKTQLDGSRVITTGVYGYINSRLVTVADLNTSIPKGTGTFSEFPTIDDGYSRPTIVPVIEGGAVYFVGSGAKGQSGIYTNRTGSLTALVNTSMKYPGRSEKFLRFGGISVSNGVVAFRGGWDDFGFPEYGVLKAQGSVTVVADSEHRPFMGVNNRWNDFGPPSISGDNVAMLATDYTVDYVCARINGNMLGLAQEKQAIAGVSGEKYDGFGDPVIGGNRVVFSARGDGVWKGLLYYDGVKVRTLVDNRTAGSGGRVFMDFLAYTVADGEVAFLGKYADGSEGIYTIHTDKDLLLHTVMETGSNLDGRTISDLEMSSRSLDAGLLVMTVGFGDGTSGIYMTHAPEPAAAGMLGIVSAALVLRRKRRAC